MIWAMEKNTAMAWPRTSSGKISLTVRYPALRVTMRESDSRLGVGPYPRIGSRVAAAKSSPNHAADSRRARGALNNGLKGLSRFGGNCENAGGDSWTISRRTLGCCS